jgi:hypothetical protein
MVKYLMEKKNSKAYLIAFVREGVFDFIKNLDNLEEFEKLLKVKFEDESKDVEMKDGEPKDGDLVMKEEGKELKEGE